MPNKGCPVSLPHGGYSFNALTGVFCISRSRNVSRSEMVKTSLEKHTPGDARLLRSITWRQDHPITAAQPSPLKSVGALLMLYQDTCIAGAFLYQPSPATPRHN